MDYGYPVNVIQEGMAKILIPELDVKSGEPIQHLRSEAPVFYNPIMRTNRDTAVLVLRTYQKEVDRPVTICEPMTGSGVRGVRLLLEAEGVERVTLGDLNPSALKLARENGHLNKVSDKINLRELDANLLLSLHSYPAGKFDYVDIDPYGSPAPFLDAAINATKNHGVIALTATDMAPLCGVNKNAGLRKYGGLPIRADFCHEAAIRLMSGAMIKRSAVYEYGASPIFSYYSDHYVRGYYRIDKGARKADKKLEEMGYVKHCPSCLHIETSKENCKSICPCGQNMNIGGPLWLGELSDPKYTERMIKELEDLHYLENTKTEEIIQLVKAEFGYPVGYFIIDSLCKLVGSKSIATEDVMKAIESSGFNVTRAHYDPRSIKTNATSVELQDIFYKLK